MPQKLVGFCEGVKWFLVVFRDKGGLVCSDRGN